MKNIFLDINRVEGYTATIFVDTKFVSKRTLQLCYNLIVFEIMTYSDRNWNSDIIGYRKFIVSDQNLPTMKRLEVLKI